MGSSRCAPTIVNRCIVELVVFCAILFHFTLQNVTFAFNFVMYINFCAMIPPSHTRRTASSSASPTWGRTPRTTPPSSRSPSRGTQGGTSCARNASYLVFEAHISFPFSQWTFFQEFHKMRHSLEFLLKCHFGLFFSSYKTFENGSHMPLILTDLFLYGKWSKLFSLSKLV